MIKILPKEWDLTHINSFKSLSVLFQEFK
jgi:hypothetical protein